MKMMMVLIFAVFLGFRPEAVLALSGPTKQDESHDESMEPFDSARVIDQVTENKLEERHGTFNFLSRIQVEKMDRSFIESIEFISPFKVVHDHPDNPEEWKIRVIRGYQMPGSKKDPHAGFDIVTDNWEKQTLVSSAAGKVITASKHASFGWHVVIELDASPDFTQVTTNKYFLHYAHLASKPLVNEGDPVAAGTELGIMGKTGATNAIHLHLELLMSDETQVPDFDAFKTIAISLNSADFPMYHLAITRGATDRAGNPLSPLEGLEGIYSFFNPCRFGFGWIFRSGCERRAENVKPALGRYLEPIFLAKQ